eukprot:1901825-Pyramimonas_sp.AAC.1
MGLCIASAGCARAVSGMSFWRCSGSAGSGFPRPPGPPLPRLLPADLHRAPTPSVRGSLGGL